VRHGNAEVGAGEKGKLHVRREFVRGGRRFADAIFPEIISETRDAVISSDEA